MIKRYSFLLIVEIILIGCSGGERTRYVEDNGKEEFPKLETLSNYPNSIVIDKSTTDSGKCYYVTIKHKVYSTFLMKNIWRVINIRVSRYEFEKYSCGDSITNN